MSIQLHESQCNNNDNNNNNVIIRGRQEWNVGSMPGVDWQLRRTMQRALMDIGQFAANDSSAVRRDTI